MTNKRYYWLKLKNDFFQQIEIKKLRKIAGGDTYTIIYLKLQLLSLKNNCKLLYESIEDTFSEEMALEIDEDVENVKMTLLFLQKYGLIEEVSCSEFILPKTLENIGTESQGAARVRKHRETKGLLQCNAPVTSGNTEIEKELEQDLEVELDIKNGATKKGEDYSLEFLEFWQQYPRKKEKLKGWRAWKTRLREKCSPEQMIGAAGSYALACKGVEERYIKLGATFLGPDKPFEEYVGGDVHGEHREQARDPASKDYTEDGKYANFFK